jgi:hypothetical protein
MEPVTLTAATIATLLFSEAVKEGGKSLGAAVSKVLGQLMAIVRQRFKAGGTEGLLARAEKQPTAANINLVQAELVAQMSEDEGFAAQLQDLLAQLEAAGAVRQVMASGIEVTGDFEAKEMRQKTGQQEDGAGSIEQEMLTNVKAQNIRLGKLSQES